MSNEESVVVALCLHSGSCVLNELHTTTCMLAHTLWFTLAEARDVLLVGLF